MGLLYIAQVISARGFTAAVDLNTFNFIFIMAGLLLHWKPRSFVRAVNAAVPSTAGVLIQFPFYGGIFGIVTMSVISENARALLRAHLHSRHVSGPGGDVFRVSRPLRPLGRQ